MSPQPLVSVVVIVYNDARRLPTAVRSVLRQSLRRLEVIIADDCSTDDTPAVAQSLVDSDPRVRYVRLPHNSGGCGAPRNAGIEMATADRVMFLDSDDRLERHACKNLLEALEDADADFSMGLVRREYMDTKRQTLWYPAFFRERKVIESIDEMPELIEEALSVNKLYRREFLDSHRIRFPEDIHYEDQVFTIQAYTMARRIAIIPENVYLWRIFPTAATKSISNQRHRLDNFRSRLEAHRRIDAYLDAIGLAHVQRTKDRKFLSHDMRLYLADVVAGDPATTREVLALAEPYLGGLARERFLELPKALGAAYGMALRGDLAGLRQTMLFDRFNIMAFTLAEENGRVSIEGDRASAEAAPGRDFSDELAEELCDVTTADWLRAPFGTYHHHHEVTSYSVRRRDIVLRGFTHDTLGKFAAHNDWSMRLVARRVGHAQAVTVPIEIEHHDSNRLEWRARIASDSGLFKFVMPVEWSLRMEVTLGRHKVQTHLLWPNSLAAATLPIHLVSRLVHGRPAELGPDVEGRARLSAAAQGETRRRALRALDRRVLARIDDRRRDKRPSDQLDHSTFFENLQHLPLDPSLVLFEANMGTIYGDSPKYVYERMRQLRPDLKSVWVLPKDTPPPHPDTRTVVRGSRQYLLALAQASYWVDNQTLPAYVRKRPGQRYLQTWHGIPLKRMGKDVLGWDLPERLPDRGIGAWDHLVVPNPYFAETFVPAFAYEGKQVRWGTPRNDVLVNGTLTREEARRLLDLPDDAKIVLYAPTFRESLRDKRSKVTLPFDVDGLLEALGPEYFLLLRPHYLNKIHVPGTARYRAIDASTVQDVNLLYIAADVLVTDYSSVMFDFALLGKPMIFHTFDYDEYLMTRGTYFDLRAEAPGPFTTTTDELVAALRSAESGTTEHAAAYDRFLERFCGMEDGHASERAVLALLEEMDA
ncbi:hypothetical protein GCM10009721_34270 [Terrabacter tumescens]|uniref:Glycosyltransferase 2-like domain-containing protein n=1 Tax=Terrabacter tumescens TaxID=60443 RepID=A0ABQ2IBI6_9MICO|nr:CDP-glycerol glycerophosphotransferase family protein [Terrabacter tumescens]GGN04016.1 hypothetical protein GCM10009721_34270 [Terrabacter tumescens]